MMRPEMYQVFAFIVLSLGFFTLSVFFLWKNHFRLRALNQNKPCSTYLKMRLEIIKIFNKSVDDEDSGTRFGRILVVLR